MRSAKPGDRVTFRHRGRTLGGKVLKVVTYRSGYVAAHVLGDDGRVYTGVAVKRDILAIAS